MPQSMMSVIDVTSVSVQSVSTRSIRAGRSQEAKDNKRSLSDGNLQVLYTSVISNSILVNLYVTHLVESTERGCLLMVDVAR